MKCYSCKNEIGIVCMPIGKEIFCFDCAKVLMNLMEKREKRMKEARK
jgi:DNA-directed RNA polymerase subunit N (RpoN/RPB10)